MKLDFTVWVQRGMLPDLFSSEDSQRHTDINLPEVATRIANAELPVPPACRRHLSYGASLDGNHISVVLDSHRGNPYPHVMSGNYADLLPVWRSYALMLFAHRGVAWAPSASPPPPVNAPTGHVTEATRWDRIPR